MASVKVFLNNKILYLLGFVSILYSCNNTTNNRSSNKEVLKGYILDVEIDHMYELHNPESSYENNQVYFNLELINNTPREISYKKLIGKIDPYVTGFRDGIETMELILDSTSQKLDWPSKGLLVIESSDTTYILSPGEKTKLKCRLLSEVKGFSLLHIMSIYHSFFESNFSIKSVDNNPSFVFSKKNSFEIKFRLDHQPISGKDKELMRKTDNLPEGVPDDKFQLNNRL